MASQFSRRWVEIGMAKAEAGCKRFYHVYQLFAPVYGKIQVLLGAFWVFIVF